MSNAPKHANYKGNRSPIGQMVGPTHSTGEFYVAVDAEYDEKADTTRVGFALGARDAR